MSQEQCPIDWKQLAQVRDTMRQLRALGVKPTEYNLLSPWEKPRSQPTDGTDCPTFERREGE